MGEGEISAQVISPVSPMPPMVRQTIRGFQWGCKQAGTVGAHQFEAQDMPAKGTGNVMFLP